MARKHKRDENGDEVAVEERLVMVSSEQQAREQFAREVAELRANPIDESTRPGGLYRVGGQLVDANGNPVKD